MEYVIETSYQVEFVYDAQEIESFEYDAERSQAVVTCYDPDSSETIDCVTRWYLRSTS